MIPVSQHASCRSKKPKASRKPKVHKSAVPTRPEPLIPTQSNAWVIEISDKEEVLEEPEDDNNVNEEEDIEDDAQLLFL